MQIVESEDSFGSLFSESVLKNVSLNKGVDFKIENRNNEANQCKMTITSKLKFMLKNVFLKYKFSAPSNKKVTPTITKTFNYFKINFVPFEVGPHQINILLDSLPVPGCPFTCNVYDVNRIKVAGLTNCFVGNPFTFLGMHFKVIVEFLL